MSQEVSLKFIEDANDGKSSIGRLLLFVGGVKMGTWDIISGLWGKGPAPTGKYKASALRKLLDSDTSFKKEGFAWVLSLAPQFKTDRTDLAIHPDGGIKGTLGCIGIQNNDLSAFYIFRSILGIYKSMDFEIIEVKK